MQLNTGVDARRLADIPNHFYLGQQTAGPHTYSYLQHIFQNVLVQQGEEIFLAHCTGLP